MIQTRHAVLLAALLCWGCTRDAGTASPRPPPKPAEQMSESFHNLYQTDGVYFAGLPTERGFAQMQEAGVTLVVNLLTEPEVKGRLQFDEQALSESLGMTYVHIPVSPESYSREDVDRLAEAMAKTDGKVLIHCASSNRVGALWANYLMIEDGLSKDEALRQGQAAGMKAPAMVAAFERVAGG